MAIGELLQQVRAHYLDKFRSELGELQQDAGLQLIPEAAFTGPDGDTARRGALNLPTRGDLFLVRNGQVVEARQVDTETMLGFRSVKFEWDGGLQVELRPFQWNFCPFSISGTTSSEDLEAIARWFERWFEPEGEPDPPFAGVVHYLSDPEVEGQWVRFDLDLGSAPVGAMEELLDACCQTGASRVQIGDDVSAA